MANAVVRDVVVKNSSTTKIFSVTSKESDKENYDTITFDKCSKADQSLAECSSSCACRTAEQCSDSSKSTRIKNCEHLKRKTLAGIAKGNKSYNKNSDSKNEKIVFCRSNKNSTFHPFSRENISSFTTLENTSTEQFSEPHSFRTPPSRSDTRSLGILQEIRSPLYGSSSKGISLRSQKPFYTQRVVALQKINSSKRNRIFKEDIEETAIEAISMNGGKPLNNGPVGTFWKTNSSGGIGNAATDINRNSDAPRNWTVMTSTNAEKREHLYKILVIGELGTGKTSFIKRYVHQFFSQNYRATIGVDFALKVLHWDPNTIVRLQLWDIAGQERFGNMTRVYYKEAVGAFIVFDVTRSGTFDCVSKWKEDLDSKVQLPDGSPIPCILLANKCDQDKQGVVTNTEKMDEYVKEHGFAGWFETSAKENVNIDEAARALVNKILLNDKLISAADLADSEKFNLNNSADQSALDGKSKCSC